MNPDIFTYTVKHGKAFGQVQLESKKYVTLNIPFVEPMEDEDAIKRAKEMITNIQKLTKK